MGIPTNRSTLPVGTDAIGPIRYLNSVTPNDSADLGSPARALYVGVSGDVAIHDMNGDTVTIVGLAAGVVHPIAAKRVMSTNTTATSILAGY